MQPNRFNNVVTGNPSLLATHTVLRNTYLLLSLTLLCSALMAGLAMASNAAPMNPILVLVGYMGLLFLTNMLRNSPMGLVAIFAFTGFMGWTLGPMLSQFMHFYSNGSAIIMTAFGATGAIFLSLSGYVLVTRKDFSFLGGFLFIGMIGLLITSVIGMFFQMPLLQIVISCFAVLMASGLILFDTSRIINNGETNYIMATVQLYLDIYMLFVNLLQILGALSGDRR